ncbi:MAG: hypothetical protein J6A78_01365 [Clostridia bacterium]|nr:hypothetical protein [Clostridia bacterium]
MKKIAALLLVFIMLFSLCACNPTKLTVKNLKGTWEAKITLRDCSELADEEIVDDEDIISKEYIDRIYNLSYTTRFVFKKDGTLETKISKESFEKLLDEELEIMLDFYKNEGVLLTYQALGYELKNNEELEAFLVQNGTSFQAVLDSIEITLLGVIEKSKKEITKDFGELTDDGYYTTTETFTVNEDSITCITEEDKEEITYCKLTDKNTLVFNKVYFDFEEHKVNITLKRVK